MSDLKILTFAVIVIVTTISAWVVAVRMRRRIRRALGKEVSEAELTSLSTWMKVEDEEERRRGGKLH